MNKSLREDTARFGETPDAFVNAVISLSEGRTYESDEAEPDSPVISRGLVARIGSLPLSEMTSDQIGQIRAQLTTKVVPNGDANLRESVIDLIRTLDRHRQLAEEREALAGGGTDLDEGDAGDGDDTDLTEVKAKRIRRRSRGKAKRRLTKQCPQGYRMKGGRCVPSRQAVGGAGKLAQERRKKKKYGRTGAGKKAKRRADRFAKRFGASVGESFAGGSISSSLMESVNDRSIYNVGERNARLAESFANQAFYLGVVFEQADPNVWEAFDGVLDAVEESIESGASFNEAIRPLVSFVGRGVDIAEAKGFMNGKFAADAVVMSVDTDLDEPALEPGQGPRPGSSTAVNVAMRRLNQMTAPKGFLSVAESVLEDLAEADMLGNGESTRAAILDMFGSEFDLSDADTADVVSEGVEAIMEALEGN
jgi:hypothetical protein